MFSYDLITDVTKNEVLTTNDSNYSKASKLVNTFHSQQKALQPDKVKKNIITLCKVIGDMEITKLILQKLGMVKIIQ